MKSHIISYLNETIRLIEKLGLSNRKKLDSIIDYLTSAQQHSTSRVFIMGLGGSAATASHFACDLRKVCNIDAIALTDNVAELTARANDDGLDTIFEQYLIRSLHPDDIVFVLSVGGGTLEVSTAIVRALNYAKAIGSIILGITGRDGGHTAKVAHDCVIIPTVNPDKVTPHVEGMTSVLTHLIISDPRLQLNKTKWESMPNGA